MATEKQVSLMTDVLGITEVDYSLALAQGLETLGYDVDDPVYEAMATTPPGTNRLFTEASIDTQIITSLMRREVTWSNTLNDWSSYQFMVQNMGKRSESGGTALLIGALTALSSRSFVRLAEEEYGADLTCIIDLSSTKPKAGHGTFFAEANGLRLPFATGSMDFVHTNRLIHMLKNPSNPEQSQLDMLPRLAREIARVLAPGGQLFMYETIPGYKEIKNNYEAVHRSLKLGGQFKDLLKRAGLAKAYALPGSPLTRAEHLFDPQRDFEHHRRAQEVNTITFSVYAAASA